MSVPIDREKLLSRLRLDKANVHKSVEAFARSYKACRDAGMDVSDDVPDAMGERLMEVLEGRLHPDLYLRLGHQPSVIEHLSALPLTQQEKVLQLKTVKVIRSGKPCDVPLTKASATEIRNAIDPNTGRVRSAELQLDRLKRQPRKDDHTFVVTVTYPEWLKLSKAQVERGMSIPALAKQAMRNDGLL